MTSTKDIARLLREHYTQLVVTVPEPAPPPAFTVKLGSVTIPILTDPKLPPNTFAIEQRGVTLRRFIVETETGRIVGELPL